MTKSTIAAALCAAAAAAGAAEPFGGVETKGTAIVAAEQAGRRFVVIDSAADDGYVWEWKPESDRPEVAKLAGRFGNPSDVRPKPDGKLLVICSGGGFAKIDVKTGKAEFAGVCGAANPHSIEELPDGRVACASSDGNAVTIIDPREHPFGKGQPSKKVLALTSAHGVVWDAKRKSLWALGATEIVELEYLPETMEAKVKSRHEFIEAGCGKWGHDLVLRKDGTLSFTTHDSVSSFDPRTGKFTVVETAPTVKSISFGAKGEMRCVPKVKWRTDTIAVGEKRVTRAGARFYKARYLAN